MSTEFSDRPLVAGSIRGLRSFRVRSDGQLTGVSVREISWTPGVNAAQCVANYFFLGWLRGRKNTQEHQLAGLGCGCGFYAYFDGSNEYRLYLLLEEALDPGHVAGLTGIIEGTGVVTVGSKGFRASKAEIVALVKPEPAWMSRPPLRNLAGLLKWRKAAKRSAQVIAKVRATYPDVPWYDSVTEALAAHPLTPPPDAEPSEPTTVPRGIITGAWPPSFSVSGCSCPMCKAARK